MATKKENTATKMNQVIEKTKNSIKKANNLALNTTEEVVIDTITFTEQWQKVADKALKGGFKLLSNQQNITFDTLETLKSQFISGKKRFKKVFA